MSSWGLVKVSVADVRREPDHRSEQITQAILGMALEIVRKRPKWVCARLPDGYLGWVSESLLHLGDENLIRQWSAAPKVMVTAQVALIRSQMSDRSIPVSDAVMGTQLQLVQAGARWTRIALPDGRGGWIARRDIIDEDDLIHLEGGSPQQIITTARSFTGIPYLWGGSTPKGFDCSGFVQTVFRLNGYQLPRDAYQQFTRGKEVPGPGELRPADLLFFQAQGATRITHVAIQMRGTQFIHCSGYVRTNSLDRSAEDYDASLEAQYVGAKNVLGGVSSGC